MSIHGQERIEDTFKNEVSRVMMGKCNRCVPTSIETKENFLRKSSASISAGRLLH